MGIFHAVEPQNLSAIRIESKREPKQLDCTPILWRHFLCWTYSTSPRLPFLMEQSSQKVCVWDIIIIYHNYLTLKTVKDESHNFFWLKTIVISDHLLGRVLLDVKTGTLTVCCLLFSLIAQSSSLLTFWQYQVSLFKPEHHTEIWCCFNL